MSRRKRQREYYALAGCNAYGVYNNYDEALLSKTYVKKANIKKFSNFEDAKEWRKKDFMNFKMVSRWVQLQKLREQIGRIIRKNDKIRRCQAEKISLTFYARIMEWILKCRLLKWSLL